MIELRGIRKSYQMGGAPVEVLRAVDLDVARGDFVALVGRSGSGKSTLLHILGCLDHPDAGSYRLDGAELGALDDDARARLRCGRIGFVFQSFHLLGRMTALENVAMPMAYARVAPRARRRRAAELLGRVGLAERAGHRPTQLSGGEQQRVAVARALANEPTLLLADEPTGNLDARAAESVIALFGTLRRELGLTVVLVTHDPVVARAAERQVTLAEGRVVGSAQEAA
ncbi:MAG TPA: ABC transporter ATP-binding protein [Myxococcota bacterium]|nr:ABC transporter ATP-binding protein [Myxococcota bacterium]